MRREHWVIESPGAGPGNVMAYGHYGRPMIVFPTDMGRALDFEERGMLDALSPLLDAGRVKLYCVDSFDQASWRNPSLSLEDRARSHGRFEDWVVNHLVPAIHRDCRGEMDIGLVGCSFGAYHAANFCLKRADLFPLALCLSGVYDVSVVGGGWERGTEAYFNNPMDYLANMEGGHLEWMRGRARLHLVCGQGMWEDTTGALQSTRAFARLLEEKGIPHELDLWGWDVPHDWPSWRSQLAHHLPRFC